MEVVELFGVVIEYDPGPAVFVHAYVTIVPSTSLPDPTKVVDEVGKVIFLSVPAKAVGLMLAGLTVISISSKSVSPSLSVTVSLNVTSAESPVTVVEADVGFVIVPDPLIIVHE